MHGRDVTLNPVEQRLAHHLALQRFRSNRAAAVANSKMGEQSDAVTDLEGIGAEIAWCKLNNCYPDLEIVARGTKYDALTRYGERIDVKGTRYTRGKLVAVRWKTDVAIDFFCLMVGTFPTYRIAGYMSASELLNAKRVTDLGHGPTFAAEQHELTPEVPWQ